MRKQIQDLLPPKLKLHVKRWVVSLIGSAVGLLSRTLSLADYLRLIALKHGLDLDHPLLSRAHLSHLTHPLPPFSAHDFLFLCHSLSSTNNFAPPPAAPLRTSIIIPVFNQVEFTFQCLRSLLREVDVQQTEIIIINNASQDETPHLLSFFREFVRVITNEENRGFVDACNQGAATARGQYLLFLNNDTAVLHGWLPHLLDTMESDEQVGAVGSMLLYPDGRVQEAGAGVWKDGTAYHYGWGKSAEGRKYNFAREVDYCSGASLLVRRELFEQLGGFDRRYAPAYYEDIDLCFGVRSLGYKVIYQPMSKVVHYEGVTAGRDTAVGYKHFQEINREKFVEKWREVLEREHVERDERRLEEVANRKQGPRIIIFDDRIPSPDRDAGSGRMFIILKSLAKWSHPVFVFRSKPLWPEYERLLGKEGVETSTLVDYPRLLKSKKFDAAILSRPDVASTLIPSIRRASQKIKIIFDMVDAYFIRLEREYKLVGDIRVAEEAAHYKELEVRLARSSDQVWCNSSEDKKVMAQVVPADRIVVIPTIHPLHDRGKPFEQRQHLLFIGNLLHRPNSDAVHYFVEAIYPLIRESIPEVKFNIVGSNPSPEIAAYASEDVRVLGYVPDINPLLQSSRVMVAPLRFGAGVKGKIGEALSYGLPVVTTSIGAEGFGLRHGEEAMIADTPQEFADAVIQTYYQQELWQRLADNGYIHIERYFTPQVLEKTIYDAVKQRSEQEKEPAG